MNTVQALAAFPRQAASRENSNKITRFLRFYNRGEDSSVIAFFYVLASSVTHQESELPFLGVTALSHDPWPSILKMALYED